MGFCVSSMTSSHTTSDRSFSHDDRNAEEVHLCATSTQLANINRVKHFTDQRCSGSSSPSAGSASNSAIHSDDLESSVQKIVRECIERRRSNSSRRSYNEELAYVNGIVEELLSGPQGVHFAAHPSLLYSNRAALLSTGEFASGETIERYHVLEALSVGSVGRSYSAQYVSEPSRKRNLCVCKVVNFALREKCVEGVLKDQYVLKNLNHATVLRCLDVLKGGKRKNMIFVTPFMKNGSIRRFAGKLDDDPEKLKLLLHDVGVGLRVLHSHELYHNNLKLDNVLINSSGAACIADAGFWRLFASQSPRSLHFNGELACMPPEIFTSDKSGLTNPGKADMWSFGIFMFRMVYGYDPFNVEGKTFDQIRNMILFQEVRFPSIEFSFGREIQDVISLCLNRVPSERPTIVRLLRHNFFRSCLVRTQSFAKQNPGSSYGNLSALGRSSGLRELSKSLSSLSGAVGTSRIYFRHGFTVDAVLGTGRQSETLLVCLRRNPSKLFTLKVMKYSILQRMMSRNEDKDKMREGLAFSLKASHPNLLPFLEIVDDKDGCFATQEFVDGVSLKKKFPLFGNKEEPVETLQRMLFDCICGLRYLHKNGVAHLSLTPSNIFYKREQGYILADFGPLFCTKNHVLCGAEGKPWYLLPSWILEDLRNPTSFGASVDIFCVGLLASSVVPYISQYVWGYFESSDKNGKLNVKRLLREVSKKEYNIPRPLIDFINKTLTTLVSVEDLYEHAYFKDIRKEKLSQPIVPMKFTKGELENCVHDKFHCRDESRLLDILGQDPMESVVVLSVGPDSSINDTDDFTEDSCDNANANDNTTVSLVHDFDQDRFVSLPFEDKIVCGLCNVELSVVLFKCSKCENYVRCGKCSVSDEHGEDHVLEPYLIHIIEHDTVHKRALIVSTSYVHNTQVLEELEMQANLPVGALTKPFSERPTVNSSVSSSGNRWNGISGKLLKSKFSTAKKLPKASEIDDSSWEEEVQKCREKRCAELLLYRFDLTAVPKEMFDPPLTHVMHLDLSYNNLKVLPHELSFLIHLRRLGVSNNKLVELPDSFGNLSELEHLDVSHNSLRDLPSTFVYLLRLGTIAMDYNDFSCIPESIVELAYCTACDPYLTAIYMAENPRITQFPDLACFSSLPSLKFALDNEPGVYGTYVAEKIEEKMPNVNIMWNKIYPDCIVQNVYCGSLRSAQSQVIYDKLNIKNLLTMGRDLLPTPPIGGKHVTISVDDIDGSEISGTFHDAVQFISDSLKRDEGCLVHCFAGMSRSATAVIAFLMIKRGMRLDEAYCLTKRGRPAIFPNNGFFKQLVSLDAKLFPGQRSLDIASMKRNEVPMA